MDELLNTVTEKTGLPADKARGAIEAVLGFLQDKLPGPIAGQLQGFLEGGGGEAGDTMGNVTKGLGGLLGKD